jgi:hypothetical protein
MALSTPLYPLEMRDIFKHTDSNLVGARELSEVVSVRRRG